MPRVAFLADVHSNLEAFEVVAARIKEQLSDFEAIVFLGDLVGYGADPNECCALLKNLKQVCDRQRVAFVAIAGNHDDCLLQDGEAFEQRIAWFNPYAAASLRWTRGAISDENREWLRGLLKEEGQPLGFRRWFAGNVFYACHGGPGELYDAYAGLDYSPHEALKQISQFYLFVGHLHEQWLVESNHRAFVSVPSIGQPRDGNPRTGYAILEYDEREHTRAQGCARGSAPSNVRGRVCFERFEYDVRRAANKIIKAGLPTVLAKRLYQGI